MKLIDACIKEYDLYKFFTLTLDRSYIPDGMDPWDYVHKPWLKLRKRLHRRFDNFLFIAVLEAHKDDRYPHIHGFTNIWLHQREWSRLWNECEGGIIVWVERVESEDLSRYVNKQLNVSRYVGKDQLRGAQFQKKKHHTLWRSKGMKADFELEKDSNWSIIKEDIYTDDGERWSIVYRDRTAFLGLKED